MKLLKNITITILMIMPSISNAQTSITYGYDAAGNRTSRSITVTQVKEHNATNIDDVSDDAVSRLRVKADSNSGVVQVEILDYSDSDHCRMILYDSGGRPLADMSAKEAMTIIDFSGKPSGVYILQTVLNGKESTWKIAYYP